MTGIEATVPATGRDRADANIFVSTFTSLSLILGFTPLDNSAWSYAANGLTFKKKKCAMA